jgi:anti-sigma regulatory factor (Ser/Thr protein kinase)
VVSAAPFRREFPNGLAELPAVRADLRVWLDHAVDDESARDDLVLAGTELVADVARHDGPGVIRLQAWAEERTVVVEISGPARPAAPVRVVLDLDDSTWVRDAGMRILQGLCDEVAVSTEPDLRRVQCRKNVSGARGRWASA